MTKSTRSDDNGCHKRGFCECKNQATGCRLSQWLRCNYGLIKQMDLIRKTKIPKDI